MGLFSFVRLGFDSCGFKTSFFLVFGLYSGLVPLPYFLDQPWDSIDAYELILKVDKDQIGYDFYKLELARIERLMVVGVVMWPQVVTRRKGGCGLLGGQDLD
ncbi:hypothetical protein Tco_0867977 [Tanacetum coccineum]